MFKKIILSLLLISGFVNLYAQREDIRTWYSAEISGELFDLVDFALIPELRLNNNSSQMDGLLGEINVSVPLMKLFRLGIQYRYQYDFEEDRFNSNKNRFGVYTQLNYKIKRLRIAYRAMYLHTYTDIKTSELGHLPLAIHRHKLGLKYRGKGWDLIPLVAVEGFFKIKPEWLREEKKIRYTAGLQYRINKDLSLGLSYKYQKEIYENNPMTSHIISTGIKYDL